MGRKVVFISYSHDSEEHRERVLALSERLRLDGIETRLDRYVDGIPKQGWPRWMLEQLDDADRVLVVCTETYYRRFRGHEQPGKGADWEGAVLTQEICDARSPTTRFLPIVFAAGQEVFIPELLRTHASYFPASRPGYQELVDALLSSEPTLPARTAGW